MTKFVLLSEIRADAIKAVEEEWERAVAAICSELHVGGRHHDLTREHMLPGDRLTERGPKVLGDEIDRLALKVDEYAMLLRMLAHHLRDDREWCGKITGLLAKHGGLGSPLRGGSR